MLRATLVPCVPALVAAAALAAGDPRDERAAPAESARPAARAARSVHLGYPSPPVEAFHVEMTILESTRGSYFMAAGWDTGYFGLQELADGRTVVIFSVWDPVSGDDPGAVADADRVECLHSAPGTRIKRFGGEGTGGQCMADFDWTIGVPNRFLVTATPDGEKTAYAGHVWERDRGNWKHLVTFRTRTGGRRLGGLYSFVEDFRRDGRSAGEVRRARFGQSWARGIGAEWSPLTKARFTASGAVWEAVDSIDAAVDAGAFMLATGGTISASRPLGTVLEIPAPATPPEGLPAAGPTDR
jgi:hypothetical protein